jgi:hypothetical protein
MATVNDMQKLLKRVRKLKYDFIKAQEYECASIMRDLEKKLMDKEVKS